MGMENASRISRTRWIWGRRSSGIALRPALYSLYSSERKVGPPRSKAAAAYSGRDASTIASMEVKP